MGKKLMFFGGIFIVTLFACQNANKKGQEKGLQRQISLFNLTCIYSNEELQVSFPNWFNDTILRKHNVFQITRSVYPVEDEKDSTENSKIFPSKKYTYTFHKNGSVKAMIYEEFYDNKSIGKQRFDFKSVSKKDGFCKVTAKNLSEEFKHFQRHDLLKKTDGWACYQNQNNKNIVYVIHNDKLWRPLTIDTLFSPEKDDKIVWNTMINPQKSYKVENVVEEKNVQSYHYEHEFLVETNSEEEPFSIKRSVQYDSTGICNEFTDSTFSVGNFVSRLHYSIRFKNALPIVVTKEIEQGEKLRELSKEVYAYKLFQE